MKLRVTMDVEPNDYCSPAEIVDAVLNMLDDRRWSKLTYATIHDGERQVDMTMDPTTVTVEEAGKPRPVLTLTHRDEVSGTTIFSDGAKVFWTEGPGVELVVQHADGRVTTEFEDSPYSKAMESGIEGPHRPMTGVEEHEITVTRGWSR